MREIEKIIIMLRAIRWLLFTKTLTFSEKIFMIVNRVVLEKNGVLIHYSDRERSGVIDLIKKIKNETKALIEINEGYQIFMAVKKTKKIKGDIAEVGVYRGGSAKIICEAKGKDKALYLFDTFDGLPKPSSKDKSNHFLQGEFNSNFEDVKSYLKKYPNVYIFNGMFPSTAGPIKNKRFSFVNLDVDIYKSTHDCLEFFYPRMNKGGIIISHDYINAIGVKKAFDDFFKQKKEPIIELSGSQCLIVKL